MSERVLEADMAKLAAELIAARVEDDLSRNNHDPDALQYDVDDALETKRLLESMAE